MSQQTRANRSQSGCSVGRSRRGAFADHLGRLEVIGVPEERDEETLDFNLIIPMPEALKHTVSGGSAPLGIEILTGKPKPLYGCRISIFPGSGELGITNTNELRCWAEKERPDAIKEGQKASMVHRETG